MNVYDFDNTIYDGDSTKDIVIYGLKKYPKLVIPVLKQALKTLGKREQQILFFCEARKQY